MDTGLREIRKYNDLLLHLSDARRRKVKVSFAHLLICDRLFVIPQSVAHQAPLLLSRFSCVRLCVTP